jgi:hypothetical protein
MSLSVSGGPLRNSMDNCRRCRSYGLRDRLNGVILQPRGSADADEAEEGDLAAIEWSAAANNVAAINGAGLVPEAAFMCPVEAGTN